MAREEGGRFVKGTARAQQFLGGPLKDVMQSLENIEANLPASPPFRAAVAADGLKR
jgi:hypothetical protein